MINNRWVVLIASTLINFTMSYTYTWSVFSTPLMELFGWTAAAAAITFTLTGVMGPFSQILGGGLLNRRRCLGEDDAVIGYAAAGQAKRLFLGKKREDGQNQRRAEGSEGHGGFFHGVIILLDESYWRINTTRSI